jgi:hypothetical protein
MREIMKVFPSLADIRGVFECAATDVYVHESTFELAPGKSLERPVMVLSNSGQFGYDIDIRVRTEPDIVRQYDLELQDAIQAIPNGEEWVTNLARAMVLIWVQHPVPFYSEEVAHVVLNAAYLVRQQELAPPVHGGVFVSQMAAPNVEELVNKLQENEEREKSDVKASSIEFWRELPSVMTMLSLLNYELPPSEVAEETPPDSSV